jgi:hypothetical protein
MNLTPITRIFERRLATAILLAALFVGTALELYIHYYLGISTGYTHFYYLLIIPVAIVYYWRAVFFALYLALLHLGIGELIGQQTNEIILFRVAMFVLVALIAGLLFRQIEMDHGDLVSYLADRALGTQSGRGMKGDEAGDIEPETAAGRVVRLLKQRHDIPGLAAALKHRDVEMRYRAAIALGELGSAEAVAPLATALSDENSGVRWEAAEALGRIGEAALDPLIEALARDDDDIRWRAAIALGEIGGPKAASALAAALDDPDEYVRSRVVHSLAEFGPEADPPLQEVLSSGSQRARKAASNALKAREARSVSER